MANISAIKKVIHDVTTDEANTGVAGVRVLWDSPFYDTNYVISFTIEVGTVSIGNDLAACISDVTPAGFTAQVYVSSILPSERIVIHAMASHK